MRGHLDTRPPNQISPASTPEEYLQTHRVKTIELFDKIHMQLMKQKEQYIGKANSKKRRQKQAELPSEVFHKNPHDRNKTAPQFKKTKKISDDPLRVQKGKLKIKVHPNEVKRPKKLAPSVSNVHAMPSNSKT